MSMENEHTDLPSLLEELQPPIHNDTIVLELAAIIEALGRSHSVEEVAQTLIETGRTMLGTKTGLLALVDAQSDNGLKIVEGTESAEDLSQNPGVISLAQSSPLKVALNTKKPVWIEDYYPEEPVSGKGLAEQAAAIGRSAIAAVPLMIDGQVEGVLSYGFTQPHSFSEEEKALVLILAQQTGQALQRIRLYQAEREARLQAEKALARAQGLQAISDPRLAYLEFNPMLHELLNRLRLLLASETATLLLLDEDEKNLIVRISTGLAEEMGHFAVVPVGKGFSGRVAASRKAVVIDDLSTIDVVGKFLRERVTSVIGAPLMIGERVLGVVHVGMTHSHHYQQEDLTLLELAAYRMALTIDQARLYEAERQARFKAETAQARLAFLARVSEVLNVSLDYQSTLEKLGHLFVPGFAEFCLIDLVDEKTGQFYRPVVAHRDPAIEKLMDEFQRNYPPDPAATQGISQVFRTGKSVLTGAIEPEQLREVARSPKHLKFLEQLAPTSAILAPLVVRGRVVGVLSLMLTSASSRNFSEEDLSLVEEVARRAGLALDNARLYEEAQRAISDRDTFLSVAAHELKTPITALKAFTQLLIRRLTRNQAEGPEAERTFKDLEIINTQTNKLTSLVNHLLDITRIEAGKLSLEPAQVDLKELITGVLNLIQAETTRHTLSLEAPEQPVIAEVDPIRIEQVISNLLSNAVKYSPEGGRVEVNLSYLSPDTIRLSVRDWGLGIPPEHRSAIFNRFYQAHQRANLGGMGLGLYIARQIVELHGGRIEAEFPEDGGTRFVVTLPAQLPGSKKGLREGRGQEAQARA